MRQLNLMKVNQQFNCPYCNKINISFTSWKSVRAHASNCSLNNKKYIFCEIYGPILIESIKSIRDFRKMYPNTSLHYSVFANLRKTGKCKIKYEKCTKQECIDAIHEYYDIEKCIPQVRTFSNYKNHFPSVPTVINLFGTWNQAILESGFTPDYTNSFGISTIAKDNNKYRSKAEARFVNEYLYNKHEYKYEVKYPNHSRIYDFYLPKFDLYIEIDGGLRPEVIHEKVEINKLLNRNLIVITTQNWDQDINKFLQITKE